MALRQDADVEQIDHQQVARLGPFDVKGPDKKCTIDGFMSRTWPAKSLCFTKPPVQS